MRQTLASMGPRCMHFPAGRPAGRPDSAGAGQRLVEVFDQVVGVLEPDR